MIVPNKFTTLDQSLLAKAPRILKALEHAKAPEMLYSELESSFEDLGEFIVTLDLLYCLDQIVLTADKQIARI